MMKSVTKYVLPIAIIFVGFGYGIGVGPVPFALMGEILPQNIKQFACALVLAIRYLLFSTFINVKITTN